MARTSRGGSEPRSDISHGWRRARGRALLAVLLALALAAAACGDDDGAPTAGADGADTTSTTEGSTEPTDEECTAERVGGELTMSAFSETRSLDPTVSTGTGTTGGTELSAIYDTLMRFDYETFEFEPWVAESLVPDDEKRVWTLTLREGVTFGNGDPLTAEAVRASIARHQDPNSRSVVKPEVSQIQSMEVVDDLTLRFTLVEPWGMFPIVLADMADPEVLSERAFDGHLIITETIMPETSPYHVDAEGLAYDPDRAAQLVAEVKAEGWDGSISLVCGDTTPEVGIAVETMLNAVGFQTRRESLPTGEFASRVYVDRNYELACGGAGASDSSPWIRLARFYGPDNFFTGYQNEEFNAALRDLKLAATPEEARPAMAELQRVWNETVPSVGLGALEAGIITHDRVRGVLPNVNMMVTFAKAYIER